ncbi:HTH-type transcriptional regulator YofA [Paenibacillus antibioticophila]|uniref:HTH-type transcriptional regulator YofA n=2 Tax=Paenibacillus TaxID=44249 RepID=A0A920CM48_9BACL|nr:MULTISPECIES: LysR family transcriptional regulator [Paenibacillus]GIO38037.1 HTH-type transcriptional regulator YofA [Paenibacillus antibioticophila]GIO42339.1 HTH-type transcriptional regulator YofA [Paenibacillus apis]
MESGDLKIFQAVAREGSITKAAQALNYVQSNVTARIRFLEAELGLPLFRRTNRGMILTSAGENLLQYADQIIDLLAEALRTTQHSDFPAGSLRIGCIESAASNYLLPFLKDYQSNYPDVQFLLHTGGTHDLLQKVLTGELAGAFVYGPINESHIEYIPVFEDELVLISERNRTEPIMEELLTMPMLFFDVGCTHRTRAELFLKEKGISSYEIREFGTMEVIINGVSAGLGVSLLPRSSVAIAEKEGRISSHSLPEQYRRLEVGFIYPSGQIYSAALLELIQQLH